MEFPTKAVPKYFKAQDFKGEARFEIINPEETINEKNIKILNFTFTEKQILAERYLRLLRERIMPRLRELFPNYQNPELTAETIWLLKNVATPHFRRQINI